MEGKKQIKINIPQDRIEAKYSDFIIISKNNLGFIFNFGQRMPSEDEVQIVSRIALSPVHVKLFLNLLSKNVSEFENQFGQIKLPDPEEKKTDDDDKLIHYTNR